MSLKKRLYTKHVQRRRAGKIAWLGQLVLLLLTPHCVHWPVKNRWNHTFLKTSACIVFWMPESRLKNQNECDMMLHSSWKLFILQHEWITFCTYTRIFACHVDFMNSVHCRHLVIVESYSQSTSIWFMPHRANKNRLFSSKGGARCISRPPGLRAKH